MLVFGSAYKENVAPPQIVALAFPAYHQAAPLDFLPRDDALQIVAKGIVANDPDDNGCLRVVE